MSRRTKWVIAGFLGAAGAIVVCVCVAWLLEPERLHAFREYGARLLDPERKPGFLRNDAASCAGCRSFIDSAIEQYLMATKDEWLPRGGKTPADSLLVLNPYVKGGIAGDVTSHALAPKLIEYYRRHGTLTYEFMCYRYNEGLRADDPGDLIVMYYYKPTRWESSVHKKDFLGRPVYALTSSWDFISEEEFQSRQAATLKYLEDHDRIGQSESPK